MDPPDLHLLFTRILAVSGDLVDREVVHNWGPAIRRVGGIRRIPSSEGSPYVVPQSGTK